MKELPPQVSNPADVVELTRRLVQIPSYRNVRDVKTHALLPKDQRVEEIGVATYIADFLRQHTNLEVTTQVVEDGRFNVTARNSENPKLVLLGHTDTVKPSEGGTHDPFSADIEDGKIWGLGTSDMKSGLASIMSAVSLFEELPDIELLFYIDEETDFVGMRAAIREVPQGGVPPELMLSADGGDLELGNGCRGLIEVHGAMRGVSAHAGRPQLGVNAINGLVDTFRSLQETLGEFSNESLGSCTVNLASLTGGKAERDKRGKIKVGEQVNAVPDITQFKVDIRTSSPDVKPELIIADIVSYCQQHGLSVEGLKIHHDLGAWYTDKSELTDLAKIVEEITGAPVQFSDPRTGGYIDMQMLWEAYGRPPAAMIGAGPNAVAHTSGEYVDINKLVQARDIFAQTIEHFGGRRRISS